MKGSSDLEKLKKLAYELALAQWGLRKGKVQATVRELVTRVIEHIHHESLNARGVLKGGDKPLLQDRERRLRRYQQGLCTECGAPRESERYRMCEACRRYYREKEREKRKRRKYTK